VAADTVRDAHSASAADATVLTDPVVIDNGVVRRLARRLRRHAGLIALAVAFAEGRLPAGKQPASRGRRPDPHQELVSLEGPPDMP